MYRKMQIVLMFLFVFTATAWAQQDPWLGTWKLNIAKSKYDPGPPPRTPTTIKREAASGGAVKTTTDGINAQGSPTHTESTANYDGKDYPVKGSLSWDTSALKRIDAKTRVIINKKGGSVVRISRQTLSPDGKLITAVSVGINPQGQAYHDMVAYDKQ